VLSTAVCCLLLDSPSIMSHYTAVVCLQCDAAACVACRQNVPRSIVCCWDSPQRRSYWEDLGGRRTVCLSGSVQCSDSIQLLLACNFMVEEDQLSQRYRATLCVTRHVKII